VKSYWIVLNGGESALERREVCVPQPGPGSVLITVKASALNRAEFIVGGVMHGGPEKCGGNEVSGVVAALGDGVHGLKVGDRVMGRVAGGGWAEYAVMQAVEAIPIPQHLGWLEAAAMPVNMLVAYDALVTYGKVKAGEWVIVLGASSATGVAAIQTAQVLGAKTIGTSGSPAKLEKLEALGLDVGICTRTADFSTRVLELTGGDGANVVVNLVGGSVVPEAVKSLARKGRLALIGYVDRTFSADVDLKTVHANRLQIFGLSNSRSTVEDRAETVSGFRRDVLPSYTERGMVPVIDRVFMFDELPAARSYMEADSMVGKLVVNIGCI
jgi:NADPH:quinone reductase-like Zn-dependent oxidoreductase